MILLEIVSPQFNFNYRPKLLDWVYFKRVWRQVYTTIATTSDITFDIFCNMVRSTIHYNVMPFKLLMVIQDIQSAFDKVYVMVNLVEYLQFLMIILTKIVVVLALVLWYDYLIMSPFL